MKFNGNHGKKNKKGIAILLFVALIFCFFSINAFAVDNETEALIEEVTENSEVQYATGKEVQRVFSRYLFSDETEEIKGMNSVKKSYLLYAIEEGFHPLALPKKIELDLFKNPDELITDDELVEYAEILDSNSKDESVISISWEDWLLIFALWILTPRKVMVKEKQ